jgi:hypothetical protein
MTTSNKMSFITNGSGTPFCPEMSATAQSDLVPQVPRFRRSAKPTRESLDYVVAVWISRKKYENRLPGEQQLLDDLSEVILPYRLESLRRGRR